MSKVFSHIVAHVGGFYSFPMKTKFCHSLGLVLNTDNCWKPEIRPALEVTSEFDSLFCFSEYGIDELFH
jgi:hypothetical protein